jgi:hypothetical protein
MSMALRREYLNKIFGIIYFMPSKQNTQTNSLALVHERTIPAERPLFVDEFNANF